MAVGSRCVPGALERLERAARADENVLPPMYECVQARCTVGEISGVLRSVFGAYQETVVV